MAEQKLEIVQNGDFKNVNLKPKLHLGIKGLDNGNHIIVGKLFDDGLEKEGKFGKYYITKVLYDSEEVSFILSDKEHAAFKAEGTVGDNVKITLNKESMVNKKTGVEMLFNKLYFEKV